AEDGIRDRNVTGVQTCALPISNRNLGIQQYSYLFVDATYIKVREADKVVSKAVYIGLGVKNDGKREIVGLKVAQAESEENWLDFFDYLKERGFQSPKL